MSAHDTLNRLADELRALPRRQQRLILAELEPNERARMTELLSVREAGPDPLELREPADSLSQAYSQVIAQRLEVALAGSAARPQPWTMTSHAKRQLLVVAEELRQKQAPEIGAVAPTARSLLSFLSGSALGNRPR